MPAKRATARRNTLERNFTSVFNDLVQGNQTQSEIARKYGVSHVAVQKFVQRNAEALNAASDEITRYAADKAIADKQWRIAEAQRQYEAVQEWLAEHSLSQRSVRYDKDGNEIGETISLRKDAIDALRAFRREVAEELGALPRPDQNINVKAMLLVREIGGTDVDVS